MPRTQFLDQFCPRSLVFDQDEFRFMKARLIEDGTFEVWEIEFAAKDIEQVKVLAHNPPSGANAIVGKLGILVGGIPALDYLMKPFRLIIGPIKLQPFSLNDVS